MPPVVSLKRAPGTLAERFWSLAKTVGIASEDATSPEPKAVVRHVLRILDALSAGEVGDGVTQSTISFLTLLRQQEAAGDLSYASPEQARGETLDERSLVFSVGVLMFEELTGRHPFGAVNSPRRFARIQKCELGSGVQYFPQVPGQLRNVLMRAMGPFPEERYANLRELRSHLERFINDRADETPGPKVNRMPLKGLPPSPAQIMFGTAEDSIPTMIHKKLPTPPRGTPAQQLAPQPMPSTPPQPAPRSLKPEQHAKIPEHAIKTVEPPRPAPSPDGASKGEVPAASLRRSQPAARAILDRLAWTALGAGGALAVTLLLVPGMRARNPVVASQGPSVQVATSPKSTPLPSSNPVAAVAAVAPAVDPPKLAATGVVPVPEKFDLQFAGKNATHAARQCLGDVERTRSFGAGLLFSKEDAVARRTFLSAEEPLSPEEKKCLKTALLYTSAGAAPERSTVAEFRFKIRPGDGSADEFKFTLGK